MYPAMQLIQEAQHALHAVQAMGHGPTQVHPSRPLCMLEASPLLPQATSIHVSSDAAHPGGPTCSACLKRAPFSHGAQPSMHASIPTIQEAQSAPHAEVAMGTVQLYVHPPVYLVKSSICQAQVVTCKDRMQHRPCAASTVQHITKDEKKSWKMNLNPFASLLHRPHHQHPSACPSDHVDARRGLAGGSPCTGHSQAIYGGPARGQIIA
jgi:hypothetical protein